VKKLLYLIIPLLLFSCSCGNKELFNNPTKKVEMFFSSYQSLDDEVLKQLNDTVNEETTFNTEQRKEYIELMKKHYQNLNYEIKDSMIDGDNATVTVEIEVTDYTKAMEEATSYLKENPKEFNNQNNEYDEKLFTAYRLKKLSKVTEKVKYTLEINLTEINDEWQINDITENDQMKIHGLYNY